MNLPCRLLDSSQDLVLIDLAITINARVSSQLKPRLLIDQLWEWSEINQNANSPINILPSLFTDLDNSMTITISIIIWWKRNSENPIGQQSVSRAMIYLKCTTLTADCCENEKKKEFAWACLLAWSNGGRLEQYPLCLCVSMIRKLWIFK